MAWAAVSPRSQSNWTPDSGKVGVFDSRVFDPMVFDVEYEFGPPDDPKSSTWTAEAPL